MAPNCVVKVVGRTKREKRKIKEETAKKKCKTKVGCK